MATTVDRKDPTFRPKSRDTFKEWMARQGIPIVTGFFIEDINTVEVAPWDFKGVNASFVVLEGTGGTNDAYICEIPPAGKSRPIKHLYEEMVYVTQGHGNTTVWQKDGRKHSFEWGPGSLFAIPINAYYQHFNSSGSEPVRYYAVTNNCFVMNLFHNDDFIFNSDYVFRDRFDPTGNSDYFSGEGDIEGRFFMTTNFVPDLHELKLYDYSERGKGSTNMKFNLADQTMGAHISEFPVGTYKKCHKHGPGAHVIIVSGIGYSDLNPEGEEPRRVHWKPGSVVVPPDQWFHQHFNAGAHPARYLALRWNNFRYKFMKPEDSAGSTFTSVKEGGGQIEFEDENPQIHKDFHAAMDRAGARCDMYYHPFCPDRPADGKKAG